MKASLVGELLPAGVVAVVGDVALALPGLQLPQVQPGAVVLQGATNTSLHTPLPLPVSPTGAVPLPAARGGSASCPR